MRLNTGLRLLSFKHNSLSRGSASELGLTFSSSAGVPPPTDARRGGLLGRLAEWLGRAPQQEPVSVAEVKTSVDKLSGRVTNLEGGFAEERARQHLREAANVAAQPLNIYSISDVMQHLFTSRPGSDVAALTSTHRQLQPRLTEQPVEAAQDLAEFLATLLPKMDKDLVLSNWVKTWATREAAHAMTAVMQEQDIVKRSALMRAEAGGLVFVGFLADQPKCLELALTERWGPRSSWSLLAELVGVLRRGLGVIFASVKELVGWDGRVVCASQSQGYRYRGVTHLQLDGRGYVNWPVGGGKGIIEVVEIKGLRGESKHPQALTVAVKQLGLRLRMLRVAAVLGLRPRRKLHEVQLVGRLVLVGGGALGPEIVQSLFEVAEKLEVQLVVTRVGQL